MKSVFNEIYVKRFHYEITKGRKVLIVEDVAPKRIDIVPFKRRKTGLEQRGAQKQQVP